VSEDDDRVTAAAPGWYPDGGGRQRWWDGQAWGPSAPPAEVAPPPVAPKPKMGKTGKLALEILGILLASGILIEGVHALQGSTNAPAVKQDVVVDPADGCQRVYDLLMSIYVQVPIPSDDAVIGEFAGLRDAARANDPVLASDLQSLIDSKNATEASNATGIILRRCVAAGHITQEQLIPLGDAAKAAAG
jgi:Protein of unknown function (DUF2510)